MAGRIYYKFFAYRGLGQGWYGPPPEARETRRADDYESAMRKAQALANRYGFPVQVDALQTCADLPPTPWDQYVGESVTVHPAPGTKQWRPPVDPPEDLPPGCFRNWCGCIMRRVPGGVPVLASESLVSA